MEIRASVNTWLNRKLPRESVRAFAPRLNSIAQITPIWLAGSTCQNARIAARKPTFIITAYRFALIAAIPARFQITFFQSVNQTATPKFRPMNQHTRG